MELQEFINLEDFKERLNQEGKLIIRPSALQQFINCPAQWYRTQVLGDFQKPAAAAEAGTSLHKGAEVGYTEKIKTGVLPPLSVLTDCVVETWRERNAEKEVEYKSGEDYHTFEKELVLGITEYHKVVMPDVMPKAVEQRYSVKISSPVVEEVGGTIDIDLDNGLADIKMTGKKPDINKYTLQQSTYALLKEINNESCEFAEIHSVVRNKSAERFCLNLHKEYARTWINTIIDTLEKFYETGDVNLFRGSNPVSNFLCSSKWCGYWDSCPYVKGLR